MERGFLGSGERGSNHKKKHVYEPAGTSASIGEAADRNREVGFESVGSLDERAAGVNGGNDKADVGDVNLVTRVDTNVQDTYVRVSTSPQVTNSSFANVVNATRNVQTVNFRALVNEDRVVDHDTMLPMAAMKKVLSRYDNTLVGYFLGKTIAFPLVKNYVTNTWRKFGLQKLMKNSDGVYLFKFASKEGVNRVLERGPWLIRNSPIILNIWTPTLSLNKNEVNNVPVWIKMHNVPLLAYSEDGLSLIATQVGKPIMLDAYSSSMCVDSWGRINFARALVELSAESVPKSQVTMAIPKEEGNDFTTEIINVEYEWKPPHCGECKTFGHALIDCPNHVKDVFRSNTIVDAKASATLEKTDDEFIEVRNRKNKGKNVAAPSRPIGGIQLNKPKPKFWRPIPKKSAAAKEKLPNEASTSGKTIATSNPFDALDILDTDDNDVDTGRTMEVNAEELIKTGSTSHVPLVSDSMDGGSTPIVEKIGKLEKLIIDGKATLVDDDGQPIPSTSSTKRVNPFSKVGEIEVSDSEDEVVENPFDESANLFGGGQEFEDEYDDYDFDDYAKQVRDLPGNLDAFNAMYGTKFQGPRK